MKVYKTLNESDKKYKYNLHYRFGDIFISFIFNFYSLMKYNKN